jgi:hypothetical protein
MPVSTIVSRSQVYHGSCIFPAQLEGLAGIADNLKTQQRLDDEVLLMRFSFLKKLRSISFAMVYFLHS